MVMLQFPAALKLFQEEAPLMFGVCHLEDRTVAIPSDSDTVLVLRAAMQYPRNVGRPYDDFPVLAYYKDGAQLVIVVWALFSEVCSINRFSFAPFQFNGFLDYKILHSKSF